MKVSISKLKANPRNPRVIRDEKFEKLKKSLQEFPGMLEKRPLVVYTDKDGKYMVLGGNMRLKAAKAIGLAEMPIIIADDWTEEQKAEFLIKDNVGFGEWNHEDLANEWDAIELEEWGLELPVNVDVETLEAVDDEHEMPDAIHSDVVLGDLIEIGEHRLLCGDSTDSDAVAKLMNGRKANIAFTSPPYNAGKSESLSGNTHTVDNKYNEYNDNQNQSDYLNLLVDFTNNALLNSEYLICNIQSLAGNKVALIQYQHHFKNNFIDVAIWDKGHGAPAMAENVMTSAWEYLFFISSKGNASRAIPNANFRGTVQNIYRGKPQRNNEYSNVHAATFPVDLPAWALQFTNQKDIVLDQFLGTGTTMIASQQLNRVCYGMELDTKYCQVIIDRMMKAFPELPVKINGKEYKK